MGSGNYVASAVIGQMWMFNKNNQLQQGYNLQFAIDKLVQLCLKVHQAATLNKSVQCSLSGRELSCKYRASMEAAAAYYTTTTLT